MTRDPGLATALLEVCADVTLARGQYYWEVDVCNSSVYRIGKSCLQFVLVGSMPYCFQKPSPLVSKTVLV